MKTGLTALASLAMVVLPVAALLWWDVPDLGGHSDPSTRDLPDGDTQERCDAAISRGDGLVAGAPRSGTDLRREVPTDAGQGIGEATEAAGASATDSGEIARDEAQRVPGDDRVAIEARPIPGHGAPPMVPALPASGVAPSSDSSSIAPSVDIPELRPFRFRGQVTYFDGAPVPDGIVTLSLYHSVWGYRRVQGGGRQMGETRTPLCDLWAADLRAGFFEGEVALSVRSEELYGSLAVELRLHDGYFVEAHWATPLLDVRDGELVGDLRSTWGCRGPNSALMIVDRLGTTGDHPRTLIVERPGDLVVLLPQSLGTSTARPEYPGWRLSHPTSGGSFVSPSLVTPSEDGWELRFSRLRPAGYYIELPNSTWGATGGDGTISRYTRSFGPISVREADTGVIDLRGRALGALSGVLLDQSGRLWTEGANVSWATMNQEGLAIDQASFYSSGLFESEAGRFEIPEMPPGRYEIVVWVGENRECRALSTQVDIEDGRHHEMELNFDVRLYTVRFVDAGGAPIESTSLTLYRIIRAEQHQYNSWTLDWANAEYDISSDDEYDSSAKVPMSRSVEDGEHQELETERLRIEAPRWWKALPGYAPGLWLDSNTQDHHGSRTLLPASDLSEGLTVMRAHDHDTGQSLAQVFPDGLVGDEIVFRFPPAPENPLTESAP